MEDKLIDILQNFQNDKSYNELNAVDDIFRLFNVLGQSEQLVCEYCNNNAKPTCCDICLEDMVDSIRNTN